MFEYKVVELRETLVAASSPATGCGLYLPIGR